MDIPSQKSFFTEKELNEYLYQRFFRCVASHLSKTLKVGETYWFEHCADGSYCIRSDNGFGTHFEMTEYQLLNYFMPIECETDIIAAIKHGYFLAEKGVHKGSIDWAKQYYTNNHPKKCGIKNCPAIQDIQELRDEVKELKKEVEIYRK